MSEEDRKEIDLAKQQFAEQQGFEDWADYQAWMFHTTPKEKRDLAWYGVIKHYAESKMKALQGISDGKSQVIKDLEAKLKERDEELIALRAQKEWLIEQLNKYSNLKAK